MITEPLHRWLKKSWAIGSEKKAIWIEIVEIAEGRPWK